MPRTLAFASNARTVFSGLLRVGDALVVFAAGFISYWVRHGHINMPDYYLIAILAGVILTLNFHHVWGLYSFSNLNNLAKQFVNGGVKRGHWAEQ